MPVSGVIFDLDGTLVDTLPDIADAVNAGRRALGLADRPTSDVRLWIGEGLPTLCARAIADTPAAPFDEMIRVTSAYYAAHRMDKAALYPGIAELLDELTRRRIHLAVLSNKPHEHTAPMMAALFDRWTWAAVEGYRQEDRRKPDPRTAFDIIRAMELQAAQVMFVGDSDTDMRTAVNAGVLPVGVTWGYCDRDVVLSGGAKHLIDHPRQVFDLL